MHYLALVTCLLITAACTMAQNCVGALVIEGALQDPTGAAADLRTIACTGEMPVESR